MGFFFFFFPPEIRFRKANETLWDNGKIKVYLFLGQECCLYIKPVFPEGRDEGEEKLLENKSDNSFLQDAMLIRVLHAFLKKK